jgi:hypothetical protein
MGGHVPLMMDGLTTALPLIKAGKVKPLAVNYPTRMVQLPDVPTFKELGYPQLSEVSWFGVWSRPISLPMCRPGSERSRCSISSSPRSKPGSGTWAWNPAPTRPRKR